MSLRSGAVVPIVVAYPAAAVNELKTLWFILSLLLFPSLFLLLFVSLERVESAMGRCGWRRQRMSVVIVIAIVMVIAVVVVVVVVVVS